MQELEIKKQMLSEELLTVIQRAEGITILSNEVSELAALVADLRQENDLCYKQGLQTI